MNYFITGVAGFIGYHLAERLCKEGFTVIGIDNLNSYYDLDLKKSRINKLKKFKNLTFEQIDICDYKKLNQIVNKNKIDIFFHLAAQAGVRYSINYPKEYLKSNLEGHFNVLEVCRYNNIKHFIFASSSSVYGLNNSLKLSENEKTDFPISFYAATKKSNEVMSHSYSHLYNIPMTGIRFFTVYGPWGRPDMAVYMFVRKILENEKINVFNNGDLQRDFTYIDDVTEGLLKISHHIPEKKSISNLTSNFILDAPFNVYNLGGGKPINLMEFIKIIEKILNIKADCNFVKMQQGDVYSTNSDTANLFKALSFKPKVKIEDGLVKFIEWYKSYHGQ